MATLHKNGMEEKKLSKYVTHRISDDDVVTLSVSFPEEGQYGMDIYTRELRHEDDAHCRCSVENWTFLVPQDLSERAPDIRIFPSLIHFLKLSRES